jgi:polysaccharide deacetylase 2 family uncharacterized protein YibQ
VRAVADVATSVEALVSIARSESTSIVFGCAIPHPVCVLERA